MTTLRVLETVTRYLDKPPCRTAEQMTKICCKTAEALPCSEKVEAWDGYSDEEFAKKLNLNLDAQGRDEQGRYVEIRRIPRSGPCGEKVTRYNVDPRGCCDEATPMAWNAEATPDVLPHGQTIWIYATGGIPPYRFSVTSNGLFFDDGRRSWVNGVPYARLHAGETFCGAAAVKVSDGCSSAICVVRSDLDRWQTIGKMLRDVQVGPPDIAYIENWGVTCVGVTMSPEIIPFVREEFPGDSKATREVSSGQYKVTESYTGV